MMYSLNIKTVTTEFSSPLYIGAGALYELLPKFDLAKCNQILIFSDTHASRHHIPNFLRILNTQHIDKNIKHLVYSDQKSNTIANLKDLLIQTDLITSNTAIVAFGGSELIDLVGALVSVQDHKPQLLNIHTTLDGMISKTIGSSHNVWISEDSAKKLKFPTLSKVAISDTNLLRLQNAEELIADYAEIIRLALAYSEDFFEQIYALHPHDNTPEDWSRLIRRICEIKINLTDQQNTLQTQIIDAFARRFVDFLTAEFLENQINIYSQKLMPIALIAEMKLAQLNGFINTNGLFEIEMYLKNLGMPIRISHVVDPKQDLSSFIQKLKSMSHKIYPQFIYTNKANFKADVQISSTMWSQILDYIM